MRRSHCLYGLQEKRRQTRWVRGVFATWYPSLTALLGQWIVLPGAGGGLGHLAVQYAKAMGMRVIAVDGGEAKRELCMKLGAEYFIDFTTTMDIPAKVMEITKLGAHGVIVTAASKEGYATAPATLRRGGTMVSVGLPQDPTVSSLVVYFFREWFH